jgi:hypothetical protein
MSNQEAETPLWDNIPWHLSPAKVKSCKNTNHKVVGQLEKLDSLWPTPAHEELDQLPEYNIEDWDSAGPKPSA